MIDKPEPHVMCSKTGDIFGHWPNKIVMFVKIMGNGQVVHNPPTFLLFCPNYLCLMSVLLSNLEWVDQVFEIDPETLKKYLFLKLYSKILEKAFKTKFGKHELDYNFSRVC